MSLAEPVRLTEGQVAASGAVLARAYANDPFFTYLLSDPVERERLMPPLMTAWTRYGLLFGVVDVTAGLVEASAIWLPPNLIRTEEQRDRAGLTAVVTLALLEQSLGRVRRAGRQAIEALPQEGPAAHAEEIAHLDVVERVLRQGGVNPILELRAFAGPAPSESEAGHAGPGGRRVESRPWAACPRAAAGSTPWRRACPSC
jgi:hypothetical protein